MPKKLVRNLTESFLPAVDSCEHIGSYYNPDHCMAVYIPRGAESELLQLPAVLIAETASHGSPGCVLLEGIPASPPKGCVIIGTWASLNKQAPYVIKGMSRPTSGAYSIRFDEYAVIVAEDDTGVLYGAQTFCQAVLLCPELILPGMRIVDRPRFTNRSLLYDLTDHEPNFEYILHVVGMLNSFKANRLHFLLDPILPMAHELRRGALLYDDAVALSQSAADYHVQLTPWLNILPLVAQGAVAMPMAIETIVQLLDAVGSDDIGICLNCVPELWQNRLVAAFIAEVAGHLGENGRIYMEAEALLLAEPPKHYNIVGTVLGENADDKLITSVVKNGFEAAVFQSSMARGFVPPHPAEFHESLDKNFSIAIKGKASEFGYYADSLNNGHHWDNDLCLTVCALSLAWSGVGVSAEESEKFCHLAYGDAGELVLDAFSTIADAFPGELREVGKTHLLQAAFGSVLNEGEALELGSLDFSPKEAAVDGAVEILNALYEKVEQNESTISSLDLGLEALGFLSVRQFYVLRFRNHYRAARRDGDERGIALAREDIHSLAASIERFVKRLQEIYEESGACVGEIESLLRFGTQLDELDRQLGSLDVEGCLPSMDEIGFPAF